MQNLMILKIVHRETIMIDFALAKIIIFFEIIRFSLFISLRMNSQIADFTLLFFSKSLALGNHA